ncbi:MAG: gas vesicle protein GvpG [Candidatus Rokubacteria bacterium]|nr:gas vesicle protein GvpG [Candidatus Rokubacteria bacterium]
MLLVDDLLLAPLTGLLWVFRKIHDAAQEEMLGEADAITQELRDLYMMLETGRVTEAEFDARERALLDRLEVIQARGSGPGAEDTDEDAEADEGEGDDEDAGGEG